jgi:hypothetical protein
VYRFSLPSHARPAIAPAPDHDWQQAARILEVLEREQAAPTVSAQSLGVPQPVGLDAWLARPLRESDYLRAYGIMPDDPFWDRYDPGDSKPGPGGGSHWRSWDFNPEKHGDRPTEIALFGNEEPPASPTYPAGAGADGGAAQTSPAASAPAGDETPRIVAVMPHRGDRAITEDILAHMARTAAEQAQEQADDAAEAFPPPVQNAQALVPWQPPPPYLPPMHGGNDDAIGIKISTYRGVPHNPFGHIGIGIDTGDGAKGGTVGYYPKNFNPSGWPGTVRMDDPAKLIDSVTIPATPEEIDRVTQCINRRTANPGTYQLGGNDCRHFVKECMESSGLSLPFSVWPNDLLDAYRKLYRKHPADIAEP